MSLRTFLDDLHATGDLVLIEKPVSVRYEMANIANALSPRVVLFTRVIEHPGWRVCANPCADRRWFARDMGVTLPELLPHMREAMAHPVPPPLVATAPCQEVVIREPELGQLPFLLHLPQDAGYYCASNVVIVEDADFGRNMCYHRILRLDATRLAARIVEQRGTHTAFQKSAGDLPVAICIGVNLTTHLAASMSPPPGTDELAVGHALKPTPLVRCLTNGLAVPADAEIVLEGRITRAHAPEGPFMDLTETMDIERDGPVIVIDLISHRRDPIYHALLPGGLEHKLLMGMPREPTIFAAVNEVVRCTGAAITPGGASWLHAVVQIDKQGVDDGRLAIEAAFRGHSSLKHVWVVDTDVDIHDPDRVEWAMATRFQADRDLIVWPDQPGSSLDPSGLHVPGRKSVTAKAGFDCTIPFGAERSKFERGQYGAVDLAEYGVRQR